jgi:hypothetical protein
MDNEQIQAERERLNIPANVKLKELKGNHGQAMTTNPAHGVGVPASFLDRMMQRAVESGNMELFREIIVERNKEIARIAELEYLDALANFQENCPSLLKNKEVHYKGKDGKADTNYWYTDIDNIIETVKKPLGAAGLSRSWTNEEKDGRIYVTCYLKHRGGHVQTDTISDVPDESGGKKGIHAKSSTLTYLKRITLSNVLGISTGAKDDDGRRGAGIDDDNPAERAVVLRIPSNAQVTNVIKQIKAGQTTLEEQSSVHAFTESQIEAIKYATENSDTTKF